MINKQQGNMYEFVTHTWNPIRGKCMHECSYCYMKNIWKRFEKQRELRLDEKSLKDNLKKDSFIFVGSSTDMFAENVPDEWIIKVLKKCQEYPNNNYLFQSKNSERMAKFIQLFPSKFMVCTTIETNRDYNISKAPKPLNRVTGLLKFPRDCRMVTIEPIIDFDLDEMVSMIKNIQPKWVNIGADSNKTHNLLEPSKEKILLLINELKKFTKIINKENLSRILRKDDVIGNT